MEWAIWQTAKKWHSSCGSRALKLRGGGRCREWAGSNVAEHRNGKSTAVAWKAPHSGLLWITKNTDSNYITLHFTPNMRFRRETHAHIYCPGFAQCKEKIFPPFAVRRYHITARNVAAHLGVGKRKRPKFAIPLEQYPTHTPPSNFPCKFDS